MTSAFSWAAQHWAQAAIPLAVLLASLVTTFWLRRVSRKALSRWAEKSRWEEAKILLQTTGGPSSLWCLIISASLALTLSNLPSAWKGPAEKALGSLFLLSLTLTALNLSGRLIPFYGGRFPAPQQALALARSITSGVIAVIAFLMFLDIWGVPTTPVLLVIALAALAAALAFRQALPNLLAGLQLSATGQIKVGDYIKLETGEAGYVTEMSWANTGIQALDESAILIPNSKLVHSIVVNYGRPLKKAKAPFRFYTRVHLKELTGLKAGDLQELVTILKGAPDSVVYYHTHHFLEEHHYLTPEPPNDFALWVSDALGDEVLGERLAAIDPLEFPFLGALRERIISVIEEHLASPHPDGHRPAPEGREFHFIKSVSVILPTPYVAHDLREFVEALRQVSLGCLYFHIFEARLRLGKGLNDFSAWLEDSLGEEELAERVARLDPYNYTLEELRSALIQLIEKRIK